MQIPNHNLDPDSFNSVAMCPLVLAGLAAAAEPKYLFTQDDLIEIVNCKQTNCRLWIRAWTTEKKEIFDCAFVINARKNSDGLIVV